MQAFTAWSTFAQAVGTIALVIVAIFAWRTAGATLRASEKASNASADAAAAQQVANEQAARDSVERTRPNVFVEIVPGLGGVTSWDVRIRNVGGSSARNLTLDYDSWPKYPDDIANSVKELFTTPRTLPPTCSLRAYWRIEKVQGPIPTAGLEGHGTITASYSSDEPSHPSYQESFDVMIGSSGYWPVGEAGPEMDTAALNRAEKQFYKLGQTLVRRVSELGR